jgi:para-aminobenzoate synthetase / 4-amino-4-deoxychorismate lyase
MSASTSAGQGPRPNPRAGVFETILVADGRPIELDAHLKRLAASLLTLYGDVPGGLARAVEDGARGGSLGRLRLTVEPGRDGTLRHSVVVAGFDPNNVFPTGPFASALRSWPVECGWGDHKYADRDLLARAEASVGPGTAPLLVLGDGEVLEASRANVFVVRDGALVTPPLAGEILPGVARAAVIAEAAGIEVPVREERLTLADLRGADEVFLTGSLRGVETIREIDGDPLLADGPVTGALAVALKRRWFGDPI